MDVSPAADGAAVVVGEGGVFVGQTDGPDELAPPGTATVLLLQLDQHWKKQGYKTLMGP